MSEGRLPGLETDMQPCPACGAPVVWVLGANARRIPLDAAPSREGVWSLSRTWDGKLRASKPGVKLAFGRTNLHAPHTTTCSNLPKLKSML